MDQDHTHERTIIDAAELERNRTEQEAEEDRQRVSCPYCKAAVGEPCVMKQDRGRVYHLARADKANRARMKDLYGSRCAYAYTCSGERAMRGLRDEDLEFSCQFLAEKEAQEMSW